MTLEYEYLRELVEEDGALYASRSHVNELS